MDSNNLFEQMATITKAHAYDIVREQNKELQEEKEKLLKQNLELMDNNYELMQQSELNLEINLSLSKGIRPMLEENERLRHNMNEIKNLCNDPDIVAIQDKAIFSDFKTLLANIKVYLP